MFLNDIHVFVSDMSEINPSWKVLSDEAIQIFHASFLPRGVGIAVVCVNTVIEAQFPVISSLASPIECHAFDRHGFYEIAQGVFCRLRTFVHSLREMGQLNGSLILDAHSFTFVFTEGRI